MITFQFDQCFNDKKVIKACTDEGLAIVHRLPRELLGKPDPELLAVLMKSPNPVVTLDRALPTEHTAHIPPKNPGIVVVNYSRDVPRTITTREAAKILRKFKERVPAWHQISVQNSIIEITEKSVEIWHIEETELVTDGYLEINVETGWTEQLTQTLRQNSARGSAAPSGQSDAAS